MKKIYLLILPVLSLLASACGKDEPVSPPVDKVVQMTLVYCVNNNNLSADLENNQTQMLNAFKDIDLKNYAFLIYKHTPTGPVLYHADKLGDGNPVLTVVKRYDTSRKSIDPVRIAEVMTDAVSLFPNVQSNLFLWGHALGWVNPNKYPARATSAFEVHKDQNYAFGGEYDEGKKMEYCDLDRLAAAIPDYTFDTIWFDCCYMGSIEVAFQFRNKCNYYIGYPTEILAEGLPYNLVLPCMMRQKPDRHGAVRSLFEYYNAKGDPVTVTLLKMDGMGALAQATRKIYHGDGFRPDESTLQNYARSMSIRYYDFGQFVRKVAESSTTDGARLRNEFNAAYSSLVLYTAASARDFSGKPIDAANYSGLSTYYFENLKTARDDYYRSLDWYKAVWAN